MPGEDMDRRKERMKNECKKIMDSINSMSFVNLDDQRVQSLVMMREIARGVVHNRVEKVTKSDVKRALSSSIEKMVGSCRDVIGILSRMSCEGLDDQQLQSLMQMKEIALGIVNKRAKVATTEHREHGELIVENEENGVMSIKDVDIGEVQRITFADELLEEESKLNHNDGQNEDNRSIVGEETNTVNGDVQIEGAEGMMLGDIHLEVDTISRNADGQNELQESFASGERDARDEVQIGQVEGMMFEDEQLVVEAEFRTEDGQNELQDSLLCGASQTCNENAQIKGVKYEPQDVEDELKNGDCKNEVAQLLLPSSLRRSLAWPPGGRITLEWVKDMMSTLEQFTKEDSPSEFSSVMPLDVVDKLINTASSILIMEPNCVEVGCDGEDSRVVVVGDIHGQFHDLLNLFKLAGLPSENQFYVFNGNYVDKGAWGLEVFTVLLAWKVLMPSTVCLLRGNHESKHCTSRYGFEQEVRAKFGDQGEYVYNKCLECFKELPLASVIASCVYTTHGGPFRSVHSASFQRSKRKRTQKLELGSLEDLSIIKRSFIDAPSRGSHVVLTDILWSDPSKEDGLAENADEGLGLWWGPDCTEAFLKQSKLKLIIRSHEGPDARAGQDDFGDMLCGYSTDHVGESGKLYTLFSAPDYPQFGEKRYNNDGAYAVLKPPHFENPSFHSFKAVERPKVDPFVAVDIEDVTYTGEREWTSMMRVPAGMSSRIDFEALGISNPPSWSVLLTDDTGGTQVVEVPKAPVVEGLPLSSNLQEPHKAAYEYFLELIAALKHMLSTRVIEKGNCESFVQRRQN
ncbi:serine/threonine-protein phosphatase 7 inactive homolog isoform X2 [Ziziphus jujuba]|uniref:Serine/threonine-protein phosphatase n=1 Tax=Ziziphus jujuba TaxID=326968 RepID=A0A6P4AP50_ZIZJJ|nr:serine/threonine-protein phosphatase 7 inactive homolog isoform X2 [Ziziphus jujuba]